jgi:toxin ParE1/3/4
MKYTLSKKAANDLEQIWLYTFENWSKEQADRYLNLIFDEIEYVAEKPNAGKDISHVREGYKSAKVKSHIIFYKTSSIAAGIEVIRILHQRMDIDALLVE